MTSLWDHLGPDDLFGASRNPHDATVDDAWAGVTDLQRFVTGQPPEHPADIGRDAENLEDFS